MSVSVEKHAILMSLQPLFEEAEGNGLWFYHSSHDEGEVWCSPPFLKMKQSEGEYIWGPEHWELRNPEGYMRDLKRKAADLVKEYNIMAERMKLDKKLVLTDAS